MCMPIGSVSVSVRISLLLCLWSESCFLLVSRYYCSQTSVWCKKKTNARIAPTLSPLATSDAFVQKKYLPWAYLPQAYLPSMGSCHGHLPSMGSCHGHLPSMGLPAMVLTAMGYYPWAYLPWSYPPWANRFYLYFNSVYLFLQFHFLQFYLSS